MGSRETPWWIGWIGEARLGPVGSRSLGAAGRGFALVITLFALLVMAALVLGGHFVAAQQFRVGEVGPQAAKAFYAAEGGLSAALHRWDTAGVRSLQSGGTALITSGELAGHEYAVRLTRLSGESQRPAANFLAVATGRSRGAHGGRRRVAMLLRAVTSNAPCCSAALTTPGRVHVSADGWVDGTGRPPPGWVVPCVDDSVAAGPGVLLEGSGDVDIDSRGQVDGSPPVARSDAGPSNAGLDLWLEELHAMADVHLPGDSELSSPGPALDEKGRCDGTARDNWGAPERPGHACASYFPIVHAGGDLTIAGPGTGQGILVVEGDLEVGAGFRFHGIVLVQGRARWAGQDSGIRGGALIMSADSGAVGVGPGARLSYSPCALARAVEGTELFSPRPLAQYGWLEILE